MYWTAHHVVNPAGTDDVHVFVYSHGIDFAWPDDPRSIPNDHQGTPVTERTPIIPAGGNRVMSYLDVLAPDNLDDMVVRSALLLFLVNVEAEPNPTVWQWDRITVIFGTELRLEPLRRQELLMLARAIWPDLPIEAA